MKNISKIIFVAGLVTFASCEPDFKNPVDEITVTSGDADFSRYVSIGNSLTSGFTDNALFISGQENSFPNIIASKMKQAGGGEFKQPMMPDDIGGFANLGVDGKLTLQIIDGGLAPVPTPAQSDFGFAQGGPFNNMGVPGEKSYHLLAPGYGNPEGIAMGLANPYFARFASSPNATMLGDAAAQGPTFFTLWIGNNDVLSYATGGGTGVDQNAAGNIDPSTYLGNDISHVGVVGGVIQTVLETLVNQGGAKGAIANIPSITDIPYFTTVPHAPLSPANPAFGPMIPTLNQTFGQLNPVFDALGAPERKVYFDPEGPSAVVIQDETLADLTAQMIPILIGAGMDPGTATVLASTYGQSRQATEDDLLVFTSQTVIGQVNMQRVQQLMELGVPQEQAAQLSVNGITYPLEDQWVLIPSEIEAVKNATAAYNSTIRELAAAYDLAFIDAAGAMRQLSSAAGITYFGNTYTTTYVSGGAFSLDGVHPAPKGYAIIANYFIDAINTKYGSTLRNANPNTYPGVIIP